MLTLREALEHFDGNRATLARFLGVSPSALYRIGIEDELSEAHERHVRMGVPALFAEHQRETEREREKWQARYQLQMDYLKDRAGKRKPRQRRLV